MDVKAPAQINITPAQLITAPAQRITAPAQPPATEVVVYTALLPPKPRYRGGFVGVAREVKNEKFFFSFFHFF